MSAHAGLFYFEGHPLLADAIDTLAAACHPYGPDDTRLSYPAPRVALVYHALRVTPEDEFEQQPLTMTDGRVLTWDGRLDNRTDLMSELCLRSLRTTPDSQIVAEACTRWGDEAFERLVGDWSLAIWNPRDQHVTIACDPYATRGLFYVVTDGYCAWSTALEGLVALTGRRTDFDEDYLQAKAAMIRLPGGTPYRGISMLAGGHFVRFEKNGTHSPKQFWHFPASEIRYRDRRDYAVHLRMIFRQAVADRLRSSHPVWMELSGGWDSSSVVCMAARVAADSMASGAVPPTLATLSYTTPGDREGDEDRFIDAVLAHTGLQGHRIPLWHTHPPNFPAPIHLNDVNPGVVAAYDQARKAGVRVLLTGHFGDVVMGNFSIDLTSIVWAIRQRKPVALFQALRAWGLGSQRTAWQLASMALTEFMPERVEVAHLCREVVRRKAGPISSASFTDLSAADGVVGRLLRASRAESVRWCRQEERPYVSRRFLQGLALNSLTSAGMCPPECHGLVWTHPYLDRRVIDYMSSIPWSIVCEPGRPRALMRDALGPILPERISQRFSKGHHVPFHARRANIIGSLMSNGRSTPLVVSRGYVSAQKLARQLEESRAGSASAWGTLLQVGILESWLAQSLASERTAAHGHLATPHERR